MPHFMIVLIVYTIYRFIKPFLDNEISTLDEHGAFKSTVRFLERIREAERDIKCNGCT